MMLRDAADLLAARATGTRLSNSEGASSFFATPNTGLDPHLFLRSGNDYRLWPDVRRWILGTLYKFWDKYPGATEWSEVWIAGSGATYQWDAARSVGEPGDLDVLIGVNFPAFWEANPSFHGLGEVAQAELFNDEFRSVLSPSTAHTNFGGQVYEVTFYVNPGGTNIKDINPYAAYDVTFDMWTVRPPKLPADWNPLESLPQEWWQRFDQDAASSATTAEQFNNLAQQLRDTHPSDPHWINYATGLHSVIGDGARLFDEIHTQRHDSFQPGGGGYTGYSNVRWQAGKRYGYLHNLHSLKDLWTSAHANRAVDCYGKVPLDAAHALTIASLVGAGSP